MINKDKIIYLSDCASVKTGFGNVSRRLLSKLYNTDKYDILHICQGIMEGNQELSKFPWRCVGALSNNPQDIQRYNSDPNYAQRASYGEFALEKYIQEFKPKTIILVNDPWGSCDHSMNKSFWNKINCISWVTYDSEPLYNNSITNIDKLKNLYCWSSFAEEEFSKICPITHNQKSSIMLKQFFRLSIQTNTFPLQTKKKET